MAIRPKFAEQLIVAGQSTGATTTITSFTPTDSSMDPQDDATARDYGLMVTSDPALSFAPELTDEQKVTGLAQRWTGAGREFLPDGSTSWLSSPQVVLKPTITLSMDADAYTLPFWLHLLYQSGMSEADATPFEKFCKPPVEWDSGSGISGAEAEFFATLGRVMSTNSANSHKMDGAVVTSLTISGESGKAVKLSVELAGASATDAFDMGGTAVTYADKTPLLTSDLVAVIADAVSSSETQVNLESWSIKISNNAVGRVYNNSSIQSWVLGKFDVECTCTFPQDLSVMANSTFLNNMVSGNEVLLILTNVSTASPLTLTRASGDSGGSEFLSAGDVLLSAHGRITSFAMSGDNEIMNEITFTGTAGEVNNIADGNCELSGVSNWTDGGLATSSKEGTIVHEGSQSLKVVATGVGTVTSGSSYSATDFPQYALIYCSFWYRVDSNSGSVIINGYADAAYISGLGLTISGTTSSKWRHYQGWTKAPSISGSLVLRISISAAATLYVDDIYLGSPRSATIRIADGVDRGIPN